MAVRHPFFQLMLIVVYMLNVIRTGHLLTLMIAHSWMSHTLHCVETGIHTSTQYRIWGN